MKLTLRQNLGRATVRLHDGSRPTLRVGVMEARTAKADLLLLRTGRL
jgi:hypothetical protein